MSESRDYLKRLEALNGKPLENKPKAEPDIEEIRRIVRKRVSQSKPQAAKPVEPVSLKRDTPRSQPSTVRREAPSGPPVVLEQAICGSEVCVPRGRAYLVNRSVVDLEELQGHSASICESFHSEVTRESSLRKRLLSVSGEQDLAIGDLIFVDLETTGLGNSPVFLVGTMVWEDDTLVVRQYLARDYAGEAAITHLFIEDLARRKLLVTFNGKTFDMPYIRTRAVANGIFLSFEPPHLDLLHECRRAWKRVLPDCKLQTLERHVCGRTREGDIPGSEIPEAYHAYVRTSNAAEIVEIIRHNMLDLVTMADLMVRLP